MRFAAEGEDRVGEWCPSWAKALERSVKMRTALASVRLRRRTLLRFRHEAGHRGGWGQAGRFYLVLLPALLRSNNHGYKPFFELSLAKEIWSHHLR